MHLRPLCLAVILCLSTVPAQALDSAECGVIEEQAFTLLDASFDIEVTQSPTSQAHALTNGCITTDLDIYVSPLGLLFRAERLVFTGDNLLSWVRGEVVLPTAFSLRMDGVMLLDQPAPGPQLAWISDLAGPQSPARIDLQFRWQPAMHRLDVDGLRVEFADDSSATFILRGTAPGWTPFDISEQDFGLTQLALDLDFNGLFETAVVAPMQANGLETSTFTFAMIAAGAQSLTQSAPRRFLPASAAQAITDFALTLPAPRGRLRLTLDSAAPFNLNAALFSMRTGIPFDTAMPPGATLQATWAPRQ